MFIALYRWKIKKESEEKFKEGWHRRTLEIYKKCGSLGSRLHKMEDGTWAGYAQWQSKDKWAAMSEIPVDDVEAKEMMTESIEESLPVLFMEVADDLLQSRIFEKE